MDSGIPFLSMRFANTDSLQFGIEISANPRVERKSCISDFVMFVNFDIFVIDFQGLYRF
jgi:hypothetical protein